MSNLEFQKWVDLPVIQNLVKHAISSIVLMILGAMGFPVIEFGFKGWVREYLLHIDGFFIVGVFSWLVYQSFVTLWKSRVKHGSSNVIVFA